MFNTDFGTIFVPIDTTVYLENIYFNTINNFAFDYVDKHRKELDAIGANGFEAYFDETPVIYKNYLKFIKAEKIISEKKEELIKHYLKVFMVQQIYDENALYKINQKKDKMISKVLELEGF